MNEIMNLTSTLDITDSWLAPLLHINDVLKLQIFREKCCPKPNF